MKSLAELKRTLKPGTIVTMVSNDWYPHSQLIGTPREIALVQSNAIAFKTESTVSGKSWLYFDRGAKNFVFDGTNRFSVILNPTDEPGEDYVPMLMTYEVNV